MKWRWIFYGIVLGLAFLFLVRVLFWLHRGGPMR